MLREAMFWERYDNLTQSIDNKYKPIGTGTLHTSITNKVRCNLCPHNCIITDGKSGVCSVRTNIAGKLQTINYGEITSISLDPIEKKPLYRFYPGKKILSVGTFGCNLSCDFCQNYSIAHAYSHINSHVEHKSNYLSPEDLIDKCVKTKDLGNIGIAFTYNEPTIWYEYVYDTAKLLKENHPDFKIVLVTNGFIEQAPLDKLLPYVDAMNIDLKAFNDDYYKKVCGGKLNKVLETITKATANCHVEVTTLLVTGLNDTIEEVERISSFLGDINRNVVLHLSRYFPMYKMHEPPTDINKMQELKKIAEKHLNYVFLGNV